METRQTTLAAPMKQVGIFSGLAPVVKKIHTAEMVQWMVHFAEPGELFQAFRNLASTSKPRSIVASLAA